MKYKNDKLVFYNRQERFIWKYNYVNYARFFFSKKEHVFTKDF